MAHYAIGDIQGCHAEFCALLDKLAFSPRTDTLWLVGDLVNRGPDSLLVLREAIALGAACTAVLGNQVTIPQIRAIDLQLGELENPRPAAAPGAPTANGNANLRGGPGTVYRETLAEDVAHAFAYLATAKATTGAVVPVDGGNPAAFPR